MIDAADLTRTAVSVAFAILPIATLFVVFQLWLLKLPRVEVARMAAGTVLASIDLFPFLLGVSIGFMPFGRAIGEAISLLPQKWMVVLAGLVLGFVTTWGEPAVRILADQVNDVGRGIAFVLPVDKVVGIAHFMKAPSA